MLRNRSNSSGLSLFTFAISGGGSSFSGGWKSSVT